MRRAKKIEPAPPIPPEEARAMGEPRPPLGEVGALNDRIREIEQHLQRAQEKVAYQRQSIRDLEAKLRANGLA